ncbi:MAG: hypothetical protein ACFE8A_13030 [Candidatus Hodarchaeota archaeon]
MENKQDSNLKESQIDLTEVKEMFSELKDENDSKIDNVIGDLFYKSVKLIFDTGFDLAKKLDLDLFDSFKFEGKKKGIK